MLFEEIVKDESFWEGRDFSKEDCFSGVFEKILKEKGTDDPYRKLLENLHSLRMKLEGDNGEWKNRNRYPYLQYFDNLGDKHSQKIINHIENLIFFASDNGRTQIKPDYRYPLELAEIIILLYSACLHDIGKLHWEVLKKQDLWTDKEWQEINQEHIPPNTTLAGFTLKEYLSITKFHAKIIGIVLEGYNDFSSNKAQTAFNNLQVATPFIEEIHNLALYYIDDEGRIQKKARSDDKKSLLKIIAQICKNHKETSSIDRTNDSTGCETSLLLALFMIGDNADIAQDRVSEKILDANWGLQSIAHWITYGCVDEVKVLPKEKGVEINISYLIPKGLRKEYLHIRKIIEKNFAFSEPLDLIEEKFTEPKNEKFCIYLTYSITVDEKDSLLQRVGNSVKVEDIMSKIRNREVKYPEISNLGNTNLKIILDRRIGQMYHESEEKKFLLPSNLNILFGISLLYTYQKQSFSKEDLEKKASSKDFSDLERLSLNNDIPIEENNNKLMYSPNPDKAWAKQIDLLMTMYENSPSYIKMKINEIINLSTLLPFSLQAGQRYIITGVDGLDGYILMDPTKSTKSDDVMGFLPGKSILIKGLAGTGKTTLGLQIVDKNNKKFKRAHFITFQETILQLSADYKEFGWTIDEDIVTSLPTPDSTEAGVKKLVEIVDEKMLDIVVIDNISRLILSEDQKENFRKKLEDFLSMLRVRKITVFCLGEEEKKESHPEEFAVDGVIKLTKTKRERFFEIEKLRGQYYAGGPHTFQICSKKKVKMAKGTFVDWLFEGINVFPNIETYGDIVKMKKNDKISTISTGIEGLDNLLATGGNKEDFEPGECILTVGCPGSGKTILGLHFAMGLPYGVEGNNLLKKLENSEESGKRGNTMWLSFESPETNLENSVKGFSDEVGFNKLLKQDINKKFFFNYLPLIGFNHDEFVYTIIKKIEKYHIQRLIIDCISDLEPTFLKIADFKNFVAGLIDLLHKYKVTTMFLYRIPVFFGGQQTLSIEVSSLVDTIICLRNFDIRNQIKKGLFILKIRGREHKSMLQTMDIFPDKGIEVSWKGWATEGMLSGETGEIKEAQIFFKLFYENKPEKIINDWLIKDFATVRYPLHRDSFTAVRKDQVQAEFWSFKGLFGAGHANIRVLSLPDYRVFPFRKEKRFFNLKADEYLKETYDEVEKSKDEFWQNLWALGQIAKGEIYEVVPNYTDLGMLCYQCDPNSKNPPVVIENLVKNIMEDKIIWQDVVDNLKEKQGKENIVKASEFSKGKLLGFALPYLYDIPEFIAFFMELLWSSGGDIYKTENDELKVIIDNPEAVDALKFLNDLVFKHDIAKNPYEGDFTSNALFCRKWYSGLRELRIKIGNKGKSQRELRKIMEESEGIEIPMTVGVLNFPSVVRNKSSYAVFGSWYLGILGEAASPEIGWIFMHAMMSRETTWKRAEEMVGLPVKAGDFKNEDIRSNDPEVYKIADKILFDDKQDRPFQYKRRGDIQNFCEVEKILHNEIKKLFIPAERERLKLKIVPNENQDDNKVNQVIKTLMEDAKKEIEKIIK